MKFYGVVTALVTPFKDGELDLEALSSLCEWQISCGVHALLACGTTGETPTLSVQEYASVVKTVVEVARGKVPVMAGTGSNSTKTTVERTKLARELGADAALVVTPYYNKPQQRGLVGHFSHVAREAGLPLVLYNVPGRTGVDMTAETTVRLSSEPGIVGVKEASGNLSTIRRICARTTGDFAVLAGDDSIALGAYAVGAHGVVSVASNVVPREVVGIYEAFRSGRIEEATGLDQKLDDLYRALFVETNPVPCKAALSLLGRCSDEVRLPLARADESTRARIHAALRAAGIIA